MVDIGIFLKEAKQEVGHRIDAILKESAGIDIDRIAFEDIFVATLQDLHGYLQDWQRYITKFESVVDYVFTQPLSMGS